MDIKDLTGLSEPFKRVIDCLEKGISSLMYPYVYKRTERARMLIEKERSDHNAIIALKEAMTQDMVEVARTSRDRNELHNIAEIYGGAIAELQNFDPSKLPSQFPSDEWAAHFYDCAKDCSDEEVQILWSKILSGEIQKPGKFYKRTLTNLKLIEQHEAMWFVDFCRYSFENAFIPKFILSKNTFPFSQFQSLVDCGFVNAEVGNMEVKKDTILRCKTANIKIEIKDRNYNMHVLSLTDTGIQICELINVETDETFVTKLVEIINSSSSATASIIS